MQNTPDFDLEVAEKLCRPVSTDRISLLLSSPWSPYVLVIFLIPLVWGRTLVSFDSKTHSDTPTDIDTDWEDEFILFYNRL